MHRRAHVVLVALAFSALACGPAPVPSPSIHGSKSTPSASAATAATAVPICTADILVSGTYQADIDGPVDAAPRRNGTGGRGIDIDMVFDASFDGRTDRVLFSVWDPDSSAGPDGTHILFGFVPLIDRGDTPEMGVANIADDGSRASFDVTLRLDTKIVGSVDCPPIPLSSKPGSVNSVR